MTLDALRRRARRPPSLAATRSARPAGSHHRIGGCHRRPPARCVRASGRCATRCSAVPWSPVTGGWSEAGGRVVKNVAGYDLTKLHIGGFGAFGAITEVHLRLRALPETDLTLLARGGRDALVDAGRQLIAAQSAVAALELLCPAWAAQSDWTLAVRLVGAAVRGRAQSASGSPAKPGWSGRRCRPSGPPRSGAWWPVRHWAGAITHPARARCAEDWTTRST